MGVLVGKGGWGVLEKGNRLGIGGKEVRVCVWGGGAVKSRDLRAGHI